MTVGQVKESNSLLSHVSENHPKLQGAQDSAGVSRKDGLQRTELPDTAVRAVV